MFYFDLYSSLAISTTSPSPAVPDRYLTVITTWTLRRWRARSYVQKVLNGPTGKCSTNMIRISNIWIPNDLWTQPYRTFSTIQYTSGTLLLLLLIHHDDDYQVDIHTSEAAIFFVQHIKCSGRYATRTRCSNN